MRFQDLFNKVNGQVEIKDKYSYSFSTNGIDFDKVSKPIDDIDDCIVAFDVDYSDNNKLILFMTDILGFIRVSAYNYKNHKEIMDKIIKVYFKTYKLIDEYYNLLSDEEKLKFELED